VIYPNDVYSKTRRGGKMTDSEKAKIAMGAIFAVIAIVVFLTASMWYGLGVPLVFIALAGFVLWVFICVQIFRFLIFREQDRDMEESDMFLPYYKLRSGSAKIKSVAGEYDLYELTNSSFVTVISLKLGRNDNEKAVHTEDFFNNIQDIMHEKGLKCSIIVMKEDFIESAEASMMLNNVNSVTEPQLKSSLLSIYNEVFNFTVERGSVMCFYFMAYAQNSFAKSDLEDAMVQVVNTFNKTKHLHALRKLEFLEQKGLFSFFRRFYGLGAIDLSLSKVQFNTTDSDILKSITIYRITSKNGKSYGNPILDKISTGVKFIN